ncbi:hypothetical protein FPQ18DRAFT_377203 [Pyronema domesticum]|uniref:Uncharacterized protein n=1 Tax=Pyronema omphalodes (strain CBS 100304) TaxID=1076935 RepID=U4LSK5_PYROM|nr:hypothetical protein FPQ18DRAFT_377203 [Pyronema domesticum]CCX32305.1 Similar to conserved hypothetical protein [Ajellomyces dermatitidis SLH14081]; acc. no. XP_002621791 [Pyronema omphalodes CBS 100304]
MLAFNNENAILQAPSKTSGPNKMLAKTPFKMPLNDENGAGEMFPKTGGKKTFLAGPAAFMTPMGPRRQALAGKTTNAKAKNLGPFGGGDQGGKGTIKPQKSQLQNAEPMVEVIAEPAEQWPEIEYMPPVPADLPFVPEGFEEPNYTWLAKNYMRGCHRAYLAGVDDNGKTELQRKLEKNMLLLDAELEEETLAAIENAKGTSRSKPVVAVANKAPALVKRSTSRPAVATRRSTSRPASRNEPSKRSTSRPATQRSNSRPATTRPASAASNTRPTSAASTRPTSAASVRPTARARPPPSLSAGTARRIVSSEARKAAEALARPAAPRPESRQGRSVTRPESRQGRTTSTTKSTSVSKPVQKSRSVSRSANVRSTRPAAAANQVTKSTIGYHTGKEVGKEVKKSLETALEAIERVQREDEDREQGGEFLIAQEEEEDGVIVDMPSPVFLELEDEEEFVMTMI